MKKLFLMVVALVVATAASAQTLSFKKVADSYINNIACSHSIDVDIHHVNSKDKCRIEIGTSHGDFDRIIYDISGNRLDVRLNSSNYSYKNIQGRKYVVRLYTTDFSQISASGSADVRVMDEFTINTLSLNNVGSADIDFERGLTIMENLNITSFSSSDTNFKGELSVGKDMTVAISGSADIMFNKAEVSGALNINSASSSDINGRELNVKNTLNITAAGSADIEIGSVVVGKTTQIRAQSSSDIEFNNLTIKSGALEVSLVGSSSFSVVYGGEVIDKSAKNIISVSSSSLFNGKNLKMGTAQVTANGSSTAYVSFSQELTGLCNSSGSVYYKNHMSDDAKVNILGNGTIKRMKW